MRPTIQFTIERILIESNNPSLSQDSPVGAFAMYSHDGELLSEGEKIYPHFLGELAKALPADKAVLFIAKQNRSVPSPERIAQDDAWTTCSYLVVGKKACRVMREGTAMVPAAAEGLLDITSELANTMLGLAAL